MSEPKIVRKKPLTGKAADRFMDAMRREFGDNTLKVGDPCPCCGEPLYPFELSAREMIQLQQGKIKIVVDLGH